MLLLQLTMTAAVMANAARSDGFYRDRESLGLRWRSPQIIDVSFEAPLTVQLGILIANDNGLFASKSGQQVRHWAAAVEQQLVPGFRAIVSYGRFVEQRTDERAHPSVRDITYYDLIGFGVELTAFSGATITLEKLLAHPNAVDIGLHTFIARLHTCHADVMVQLIENSPSQASYQFWTAEGTARPLCRAPPPWRWLALQGGIRPVPSYSSNRSVSLRYLALGLSVGGRIP